MRFPLLLLALGALVLTACSSVHTHRNPQADLGKLKRYFVEHRLTDNNHIDELIVSELKRRGLEASAGPLTMMPESVDALINYEDVWAWDFKSYLLELNLVVQHPHSNRIFANATYRQPTIVTKNASEVVREIFVQLYGR